MSTKLYPHEGHVFHTTQAEPGGEIIIKYPPFSEGTGRVTVHPQPTGVQHYQGSVTSMTHWNEWVDYFAHTDLDQVMHHVCRHLLGNHQRHLNNLPVAKDPLKAALSKWHNSLNDAPDPEDPS